MEANSSFGYEQIKVLFFLLSISLIGFLWRGKDFKWTLISKVAGLFILSLSLTTFTGLNLKVSVLGTEPYFQGLILYSYLFLFYLMVKTLKIQLEKYALVLSITALLVSFFAIKDWILLNILNIPVPTYAGRVVSTFGQPNFYSGFLLLTLPFSYLLYKNIGKKLQNLGLISGLVSMIGILVSYSRSTILLALILLILGLIDQLKIKLKWLAIVFLVIFISIFIAWESSSGIIGNEISKPNLTNNPDLTKESVEKRIYIWPQVIKIAWQKPLWGYGLENIHGAFLNYFTKYKHPIFEENLNISPVLISLKDLNLDRTHNYLLDLLLFSGILGLISYLGLVFLLFKKLLTSKISLENNVLLVGLTTYLIWAQFQNQSVVHLIYFWLLAGLIDRES